MNKQAFEERKQVVGETVFGKFERTVKNEHLKKETYKEKIMIASEIVEEMPFVTMPLRESGILRKGERNTHLLHTFQPNLWAQDFAHTEGKLGKMTVTTAIERANASTEFVIENSPKLFAHLKKNGRNIYDFAAAMREAAMIESAYYTRLGGGDMPDVAKKRIDTALMRRTMRNESLFRTVLKHAGIDENDGLALLQFADEIDLTEVLQKFVEDDPYFARRNSQVTMYKAINSEQSAKLAQVTMPPFVEEFIARLGRKYPALVKKIASGL